MAEQLARSQKLEALGLLAAGVGHDLNNVLSGVVGYPDMLLAEMPEEHPLRKTILGIRNSGLKAAAIVQDLLALGRRGAQPASVLDLNYDIVQDYLASPEFAALQGRHPDIRMETHLAADLRPLKGSPVQLRKSLMNLVINAMEAQPQGGVVRITTANAQVAADPAPDLPPPGDYALLSIEDAGVGIPLEDQARIFEPFYTRKVMGHSGTGLGMTVVWGAIQDHDGHIAIHSEPGRGTRFDLYFPACLEPLQTAMGAAPMVDCLGRGEHILVVDDLAEQRALVTGILARLNYRAGAVASGEAALEYLERNPVDLILLDMIMEPGMDGLDTCRQVFRLRPGQRVIITSGYAETERVSEAIALGVRRYLRKPYTMDELGRALREELARVPGPVMEPG
jgi:CheY-like chemotaxis protein